jgi:hypothetical protein
MPDVLYFQEIDDLFFDKLSMVNFLSGGFTRIKGPAGNAGVQMDMAAQADIIQHRHTAKNLHFLKGSGYTQCSAFVGFEAVNLLPPVRDTALLWAVKAVDTVHHHGFTGSIGPYDGMDLPFSDLQADPGKGGDFPEIHVNVLKFQQDISFLNLAGGDQSCGPPSIKQCYGECTQMNDVHSVKNVSISKN